ncbi:MAG TPA: ABC transporter permease [Caulobacteraceae bacterium]|nr:ABC transporter permease [Caulobacteraceae bacterium]
METPAEFSVQRLERGAVAVLTGDWTAVSLGDAGLRLKSALHSVDEIGLDLHLVGRCDTAGAYEILTATEGRTTPETLAAPPRLARLLELVGHGLRAEPVPHHERRPLFDLLERVGRGLVGVGGDAYETMAFLGHLIVVIGRVVSHPSRMRWAPCFSLAERAGLDAIPIVAVTTLFIGAVVGFLGADELTQFGAQVFVVELIGIAVMREFNIVITAVLLAGRSSSAFAAEIGSMKMKQEIDAMQVMGVDPFEALVLPRFIALLVTMPMLTFVATLSGLMGGLLVSWLVLHLSPTFFLQRIVDDVGVRHFWIGMSKAPVMALVIAGIGCRQGMEVGGDVESLGRRVTSAVVHAIFSIILIDAVFALIYMKLDI